MDFLFKPWPWYISGFLIALTMFVLLLLGKKFGMSSNLRTMCTICGAGKKTSFFNFDWKADSWNLIVVLGAVIGGYIGAHFLSDGSMPDISEATRASLDSLGISENNAYLPQELFSLDNVMNLKTIAILLGGGLLIGFGTRYAGGCTSGHAISGLSNLQLPSLIAVIGFFIGGLIMVHLLYPLIF
ncbi:hypothetical protein SAMN05216480_101522 [Pustulibacterium marinum]|uniref:Uncharacterized protein n=1 Tax=Pustulibacterium marinum TaxID=1224947 RepID=A0A1I7F152_9FLAO|nr:YeeE/YedE thiosulfate transporter family protein [Pustulibacterium marinum]SFU29884.1 hypothetical protein SAMN05216480_101522 [Pustulibacterium marinum]